MTETLMNDLLTKTSASLDSVRSLREKATSLVRENVTKDGRVSGGLIEIHQDAAHGVAWLTTYAESLERMQAWAENLSGQGEFGNTEALIHQIAFGEYLAQIAGGIPMSQGEIFRLQSLGFDPSTEMKGNSVSQSKDVICLPWPHKHLAHFTLLFS